MNEILTSKIILNIFRNSFLRLITFLFILISLSLLLFQEFFIIPKFNEIQFISIESEAKRTANHIRKSMNIFTFKDDIDISDKFVADINNLLLDFNILKIRIFDSQGKILFSSTNDEIGKINQHEYFQKIVSKGRIYSKVVRKENLTMEGERINSSVAEVYLPILKDNFKGAFEIYYDISEQERTIMNNNFALRICTSLMWTILSAIFASLLFKASISNIFRTEFESKLTTSNLSLESAVLEKTREIKATQIVSIHALASLAEHYDTATGQHLERIQQYTSAIIDQIIKSSIIYKDYILSHSYSYIQDVTLASLLHDIGKTAIPTQILLKPEALTPDEFNIIKQHTVIAGEALLQANEVFRKEFGKDSYLALARDIALYHHEKWNGTGYPHGLKEQDIPLSARITAIADVYDALTSERPYKSVWTHEQAVEEIVNHSGTHFDPELVKAFVACSEQFRAISASTEL